MTGDTVPPLNVPRVSTRDLTLRIHLDDGLWHRLDECGFETACGIRVDLRLEHETRHERQYAHPLAPNCGCWTRKECERANDAHRDKFGKDYEP